MEQSLYVDPDELRNTADELHTLAEETAQMMANLKAALAGEGECWGNDEPGKMFAESYVPGLKRNMTGFENLIQNVTTMGSNLRATAENFKNQDRDAGNQVRNSLPDIVVPNIAVPKSPETASAPQTDQTSHVSEPNRQSSGARQTQEDTEQSNSGSPVESGTSTDARQPTGQHSTDSPAGTDSPGADSGAVPDTTDPNGAGSEAQGGHRQQTPSQPATSGPTASTPTAPASRSSASAPPSSVLPTGSGRSSGTNITATPDTRSPGGRQASPPAAPGNSTSPWSKPGKGTSPEQQSPPRVSPPRRPNAPKPPAEPKQRKAPAQKPQLQPQPITADEAMQIVNAMAARHNLRITGFESSGISMQSAQEIADAVDTVLDKYPLPLHGIEIGDCDGDLSRVENRAEPAIPEPWIVLDRRAVADPGGPAGRAQPWTRPGENTHRPMHARMLREFGHVADLAGGFRARQTAQRALITEYLRVTGIEKRTLAQVVDGYRRWRDQLGEHCFRAGVLDPGRALAEGYAAVERSGAQAPGPAKVLHRLLLVMARLDMRSGKRVGEGRGNGPMEA